MAGTFDDDPLENLNDRLSKFEQRDLAAQQQAQQAEQMNRLMQETSAKVATFREEVPDYDDALDFVLKGRAADLRATGMADADIGKVIDAESAFIADQALRAGKNPGEVVYALAQNRGYSGAGRARGGSKGMEDVRGRSRDDDYETGHAGRAGPAGDELAQAQREVFGRR